MAFLHLFLLITLSSLGADAITFTLQNRCNKTIWPGIQAAGGQPQLVQGGFELKPSQSRNLTAPKGWSGRFWGRSGCKFNVYGEGTCATGDCGIGLFCNGAGGEPPASVAEFTLDSPVDFYDVTLLDGFNMPVSVFPYDDSGVCPSVGCDVDLNLHCPTNLIVRGDRGEVVACKSACTAFQTPEYCCTGPFQNPNRCKPTKYSQYFKRACPSTYTYAFDDPLSTVTWVWSYIRKRPLPCLRAERQTYSQLKAQLKAQGKAVGGSKIDPIPIILNQARQS